MNPTTQKADTTPHDNASPPLGRRSRASVASNKLTPPSASPGLLKVIAEDWRTHSKTLTKAGLQTLIIHRFGHWASQQKRPIWLICSLIYRPAYWFVRNVYGIEVPHSAVVGRRVQIAHQSGIVIHHNAVIGDDCLIRQNCTIGGATAEAAAAAPVLGKGVQLGAGSVLLGRIKVCDNARIGPNAVVMTSIPAGATVFAPAPRVIHPPRPREQFSDQGDNLVKTRKADAAAAAARSTSPAQEQPATPSPADASSPVSSQTANQKLAGSSSQSRPSSESKSAPLQQDKRAGASGYPGMRKDEESAVSSGRSRGDDR